MDRNTARFTRLSALALSGLVLVLFLVAIMIGKSPLDSDRLAAVMSKHLSEKVQELEGYMDAALDSDEAWIEFENIPQDFVIYRYIADTLNSWCNQFPIINDDINPRAEEPVLTGLKPIYPLADLCEDLQYVNLGPKWYILKSLNRGDRQVVGGIMVHDDSILNPDSKVSFEQLPYGSSSVVEVDGTPLFSIQVQAGSRGAPVHPVLLSIDLFIFIIGLFFFLLKHRTKSSCLTSIVLLTLTYGGLFIYGRSLAGISEIFSGTLYYDGSLMYSFGALMIVNFYLMSVSAVLYICRKAICDLSLSTRTRAVHASILVVFILLIGIWIWRSFHSLINNSDIPLELHKVASADYYTVAVYVSYTILSASVALVLQIFLTLLSSFINRKLNIFSTSGKIGFSLVMALYFILVSSSCGFKREQQKVAQWSRHLSVEKNQALETQLLSVENYIANDKVAGTLAELDNSVSLIRDRLICNYLGRISDENDISIYIFGNQVQNRTLANIFQERVVLGEPIAPNSYFYYTSDQQGRPRYTGIFTYPIAGGGVTGILVCVESKSNREDRGYLSLMGHGSSDKVFIPYIYSYAKFVNGSLLSGNGTYQYPMKFPSSIKLSDGENGVMLLNGYTHFITAISDSERIVLSRESISMVSVLVDIFLLAFLIYMQLMLLTLPKRRSALGKVRTYFKSRINLLIIFSLSFTLLSVAFFSVFFVQHFSERYRRAAMTTRIESVQTMVESRVRNMRTENELLRQNVQTGMELIQESLDCDLTLYAPQGYVLMTTMPEIFDRRILGRRMDSNAYEALVYGHRPYSMQKENVNGNSVDMLYAPVFNNVGDMLAIVATPYIAKGYSFGNETLEHALRIAAAFLCLLIVLRLITGRMVDKMFRPLSEMSEKMSSADIDSLEYVIYEQNDELTPLVRAYNLMVHDLASSTKELARSARDTAWSEMARQVAHEIKNPLTPIKLKIQMLMRMKESGNPAWEGKVNEVCETILYHINILADTANQFSTFAKLYSEEPVEFDLDHLIKEEISIFDTRDDIRLSYIGLENALLTGPKPQLARVLINLITNAIQAVQGRENASVFVALRNSSKSGYYEIVVEDNGDGVSEENRVKLFTPNFTTKTEGTGLGLAICRQIVDRCKGDIFYSRSITLGGACFTVLLPKC